MKIKNSLTAEDCDQICRRDGPMATLPSRPRSSVVSIEAVVLVPPTRTSAVVAKAASCTTASNSAELFTRQVRIELYRLPQLSKNFVLSSLPIEYESLSPDLKASVRRLERQYIQLQVS